jgi:hypothetical protein
MRHAVAGDVEQRAGDERTAPRSEQRAGGRAGRHMK